MAPIEDNGVAVAVDVEWDVPAVATLCRAIEAAPDTLAIVGTRSPGDISGLRLSRVPIQLVHDTGAAVVMVPQERKPSSSGVESTAVNVVAMRGGHAGRKRQSVRRHWSR